MANNLFKFQIETHQKQSFTNLDHYLNEAIRDSGVSDGMLLVYCPHTTAAITINENADPDVKVDLKLGMNETFPNRADYVHIRKLLFVVIIFPSVISTDNIHVLTKLFHVRNIHD